VVVAVVVPFAAPSVSRPVLSDAVAIRTGTGASTSEDRTSVTSTSAGGAIGVGTPLAPVSAEVLSSVDVVAGGAGSEADATSFGDGGSGRDCRFDWLHRGQTQFLDLLENVSAKETDGAMLTKRRDACVR
jgi:hypothetical protein